MYRINNQKLLKYIINNNLGPAEVLSNHQCTRTTQAYIVAAATSTIIPYMCNVDAFVGITCMVGGFSSLIPLAYIKYPLGKLSKPQTYKIGSVRIDGVEYDNVVITAIINKNHRIEITNVIYEGITVKE